MPDKKMEIIAESPQMKKILQTIEYIKDVDSSVLITGESGTGKEVIFKYIPLSEQYQRYRNNISYLSE